MTVLHYHNQTLYLEEVPIAKIASDFGTPCYAYSKNTILNNWNSYYTALQSSGLPFQIHYAVKANSNLHILRLLAEQGAGFDVVSQGEIARVLAAGGHPKDIIFAGVGKTSDEINYAIDCGIGSLHVESEAELWRIQELSAKKDKVTSIAFRINPNVATETHQYISTGSHDNKFGIDYTQAVALYELANTLPNIRIKGIACHIGSQITTMQPFLNAIDQLLEIIHQLHAKGISLDYIDIGGGLGIRYKDENPPTHADYISAVTEKLKHTKLTIHIEPGRSMIADAGILITHVEYIKNNGLHNFAIVDAGMNDLIRPALYQSYHEILPAEQSSHPPQNVAIVGPVCESGDFFALNRLLTVKQNDLLVIKDCGAYGFSMSSNYNSRSRAAELLIDGVHITQIRKRETIEQLLQNEIL